MLQVPCGLSAGCQARGCEETRPAGLPTRAGAPRPSGGGLPRECVSSREARWPPHTSTALAGRAWASTSPVPAVGPPRPGLPGVTLGPRGTEGSSVGRPGVSSRGAGGPRCDERLRHVRGRVGGLPSLASVQCLVIVEERLGRGDSSGRVLGARKPVTTLFPPTRPRRPGFRRQIGRGPVLPLWPGPAVPSQQGSEVPARLSSAGRAGPGVGRPRGPRP